MFITSRTLSRGAFCAAMIAFPFAANAASPSETVANLYESLGMEADIATRDYYADPALTRLNQNAAAFDRGDIGCIDFSIAVDAQDYDEDEIAKSLRLEEWVSGGHARVLAKFSNFGQPTQVEWTLELEGEHWKVADVASPEHGWRLSNLDCE
jgi:hypothetical protein